MSDSSGDAGSRPVAPQSGPFPTIPDHLDPAYKDTGDDDKTNVADLGLDESVTVGMKNGSVHQYGFGGDAGGGIDKNITK